MSAQAPATGAEASADELIARCYEAGAGRLSWETVLRQLATRLDLRLAQIIGVDPRQGRLLYSFEGGNVSAAGVIDYARSFHRIDPHAPHGLTGPVGRFISFDEVLPAEEIDRHPFYQDFLIPYGVRHMHGMKLHHDDGCAVMLGLHRGVGRGVLAGAERALAERLGFHLCRAMALYLGMRTTFAEAAVGRVLLDRIDAAVLLLDADRRVHELNRAAEQLLAAQAALHRDAQQRLRCIDAGLDAELGLALHALQLGGGTGLSGEQRIERRVLAVPLAGAVRPLVLTLIAVRPESTMGAFGSRPLAMLVAYDANRVSTLDPFAVAAAFDLTPAQARVAVRLAAGASREDVAADQGVSIHTVNTHVRAVLDKLGVTRTSEMIATLRSVPLGI